ncbi:13425_t:CDS:2, partial [Ambispora leptoticha]
DIAVKEQLVTQLERAEQEFTYMRAEYEQRLAHMQETLITLQRERDAALKRAANAGTGVSTRDKNSILAELKARYEHKMKRLIQEIGELRRKYNDATQSNAATKNQNEVALKSMRAQIEQLKGEKLRMVKLMKERNDRVREMTERTQRELQNLRRKEKSAQEQKKRLERTSEMQKLMLEKRQKEVLQTAGKLKSVMTLLKRTSTPKSIAKAFRKNRKSTADSPSRRTSDDISNIHDDVYASGYEKKKLLDDAINKYITGRQQLSLLDELFNKRDNLHKEKQELLERREKIISNSAYEFTSDAQDLDDRIGMITSEITYISARIRALQSEAARNVATEQSENDIHQETQEQAGDNSKDSDDKGRRNSKSGKAEKRISFSLPDNPSPEASYDVAVTILRNLDSFESQTILESFFEDIVKLRTGEWSKQMTVAHQEKTIMDLNKSLLAMRRAAVMATAEYERRNKELEELLRRNNYHGNQDERSPSPITAENKELRLVGIEDDANNSLSWFDRIYETALAQVEAAISAKGTPIQENVSLSRRNSSHSTIQENISLSRRNSSHSNGSSSKRNSYCGSSSNAPVHSNESSSKRNSYCGPSSNPPPRLNTNFSRPPLPSDWFQKGTEVETPIESPGASSRTMKRVDSTGSNNSLSKKTGSAGRRLKRPDEGSRDSGYFSGIDKRRSQSSMAHRDSSHMRQSSYGRSSPDSDDNASVTSERRLSISHHSHVRSVTPEGGNVYDRLSRSHTQSSSAKNTPTRRLMRHVKQNSGGVNSALAALEGRRNEYETTTEPLTASN